MRGVRFVAAILLILAAVVATAPAAMACGDCTVAAGDVLVCAYSSYYGYLWCRIYIGPCNDQGQCLQTCYVGGKCYPV